VKLPDGVEIVSSRLPNDTIVVSPEQHLGWVTYAVRATYGRSTAYFRLDVSEVVALFAHLLYQTVGLSLEDLPMMPGWKVSAPVAHCDTTGHYIGPEGYEVFALRADVILFASRLMAMVGEVLYSMPAAVLEK
jgi:hypothetical protein